VASEEKPDGMVRRKPGKRGPKRDPVGRSNHAGK